MTKRSRESSNPLQLDWCLQLVASCWSRMRLAQLRGVCRAWQRVRVRWTHVRESLVVRSGIKDLNKLAVPEFIRVYSTVISDARDEDDFCLFGLQNLPNLERLSVTWYHFRGPQLWWASWENLHTIDFDFTHAHDLQASESWWPEMPNIKHARLTHNGRLWPGFEDLVAALLSASRDLQSLAINMEGTATGSGIIDLINTRHARSLEKLELPASWLSNGSGSHLVVARELALLLLRCFTNEVDWSIKRHGSLVTLDHVRVRELRVQSLAVLSHKTFALPPGLQVLRCSPPYCGGAAATMLSFSGALFAPCASSLRILDLGMCGMQKQSLDQVACCVALEEIHVERWTCAWLTWLIDVANHKTVIFTEDKPWCYCQCLWFGDRFEISPDKMCNLVLLFTTIAHAKVKGFTFRKLGTVTNCDIERLRAVVAPQFAVEVEHYDIDRPGSGRISLSANNKPKP